MLCYSTHIRMCLLWYMCTVQHIGFEVLLLLIVSIRNVLFTPQHGESALHIAAGYGHLSVVKLLIKSGAKLDSKDKVLVFFIV